MLLLGMLLTLLSLVLLLSMLPTLLRLVLLLSVLLTLLSLVLLLGMLRSLLLGVLRGLLRGLLWPLRLPRSFSVRGCLGSFSLRTLLLLFRLMLSACLPGRLLVCRSSLSRVSLLVRLGCMLSPRGLSIARLLTSVRDCLLAGTGLLSSVLQVGFPLGWSRLLLLGLLGGLLLGGLLLGLLGGLLLRFPGNLLLLDLFLLGSGGLLPLGGLALLIPRTDEFICLMQVHPTRWSSNEFLGISAQLVGLVQLLQCTLVALSNLGHDLVEIRHLSHQLNAYMVLGGQGTLQVGSQFVGLEPSQGTFTILLLHLQRIDNQSISNGVSKREKLLLNQWVGGSFHKSTFHGQQDDCMLIMAVNLEIVGMEGIANHITGMLVISLGPMGTLTDTPTVEGLFATLAL